MATAASSSSWIGSFANVPKRTSTTSSKSSLSSSSNASMYGGDVSDNYHDQTRQYSEAEFNQAMADAKKEQEKYYTMQKTRATEDATTKLQDYDRLIGYANTDLTRNLEQNNITFSRAMNRAANAYGQRGILFSGIRTVDARDQASDYDRTNVVAKDTTGRKVTDYTTQKATTQRDLDRKIFDLGVEADNSAWYSASKKLGNADAKEAQDNYMKLYNKL